MGSAHGFTASRSLQHVPRNLSVAFSFLCFKCMLGPVRCGSGKTWAVVSGCSHDRVQCGRAACCAEARGAPKQRTLAWKEVCCAASWCGDAKPCVRDARPSRVPVCRCLARYRCHCEAPSRSFRADRTVVPLLMLPTLRGSGISTHPRVTAT